MTRPANRIDALIKKHCDEMLSAGMKSADDGEMHERQLMELINLAKQIDDESVSLRAKLESERQARIAAELRAEGVRKDAEMLRRLVDELRGHLSKHAYCLTALAAVTEALRGYTEVHGVDDEDENALYMADRALADEKQPAPADGAGSVKPEHGLQDGYGVDT